MKTEAVEIGDHSDRMAVDEIQKKGTTTMDSNGITPVMPMGGDAFGGNSFVWIFGLLILLGMFNGGGFGFGGNGNTNALNADMQRGFDTQNTMAQTRDILSAVTSGTAQTIAASTQNAANAINAIKDGNASLIREFGTVETALTGMAGQMQSCCCDILRSIDGSNYNTAMQIAGLEQRLTSKMDAREITALRDQVNALQLQAATSNVLRFPNSWAFAGGVFPPVTSTPATGA